MALLLGCAAPAYTFAYAYTYAAPAYYALPTLALPACGYWF